MSVPDLQTRLTELADALPPSPHDPSAAVARRVRRHRRRVLTVTAMVAVLAVIGASTALWNASRHTSARHVTTEPTASGSATAQQLATFRWSQLPPAPIKPRSDAAVVWTGHEMVVWGGVVPSHTPTPPKTDGAAYDPASKRWRPIAEPASLDPRWGAITVWTGQEMLVIGGQTYVGKPLTDGAYDPAADRWRVLPARPVGMTGTLSAVWDGAEALVVSTSGQAAAFALASNQWRSLPRLPEPGEQQVTSLTAVWASNRLLVWAEWLHDVTNGNEVVGYSGIDLWALDLDGSQPAWTKLWVRTSGAMEPDGVDDAISTGREALLPATGAWNGSGAGGAGGGGSLGMHGYLYNPVTNLYSPMSHGPVDDHSRNAVWTGGALVRTMFGTFADPTNGPPRVSTTMEAPGTIPPGTAAAWDPATDTWTTLPHVPPSSGIFQLVWTGHEILSYGQDASFRFGA